MQETYFIIEKVAREQKKMTRNFSQVVSTHVAFPLRRKLRVFGVVAFKLALHTVLVTTARACLKRRPRVLETVYKRRRLAAAATFHGISFFFFF